MDGLPYIPGAALKGYVAQYAAALSKIVPAFNNGEKIFGTGGVQQGSMFFENGTLVQESDYYDLKDNITQKRTGVSISRYTKAKKEGQLYTLESSGYGGNMAFQSSIYGFLDEGTYQKDIAYLAAAIRLIFSMGGKCSSGLGWLQEQVSFCVKKGPRRNRAGAPEQELIEIEEVNRWIKEQIGGKICTK